MNTREYVEYLLKNYNEIRTDIEVLKVDIEQMKKIKEDEVIESLVLNTKLSERVQTSGISNTTGQAALIYSQIMNRLNEQSRDEIQKQIVILELELDRLEICIKKLKPTVKNIIKNLFFDRQEINKICSNLEISEKTLARRRNKGIEELAVMF